MQSATTASSAKPCAYRRDFCVGGVSVQLTGDRAFDVSLLPSLLPFETETTTTDIAIRVERVSTLSHHSRRPLFDSGTTWRVYEDASGLQFDFLAAMFGERPIKRLSIDNRFRRARLQINEECAAALHHPLEPLAYPLDELLIMHRLTQEKAIELHGVGIAGPGEAANLFVGHSGAGKSTTARLWTVIPDIKILSDDRIIVRERPGEVGERRGEDRIFMYGTPWHGEACFALPDNAALQRIFVLEHGYGNVIVPLTPGQAAAELFARSFVPFHRHEYLESALSFLEGITHSIPCYRYFFEPDQRAVERILNFRD